MLNKEETCRECGAVCNFRGTNYSDTIPCVYNTARNKRLKLERKKEMEKTLEERVIDLTVAQGKIAVELQLLKNEIKEKNTRIVYYSQNIYVAIHSTGTPYILTGDFNSYIWSGYAYTSSRWNSYKDGQEAINGILNDGFVVHSFSNALEGLKFFISEYEQHSV